MKNKKYYIILTIFVITLIGIIFGLIMKNNIKQDSIPTYSEEYLNYQKIFNFKLSDDENYYIITGLKVSYQNEHTIVIPNTIDNIPVKKIVDSIYGNFDSFKQIKVIKIPANIEYIGTNSNDQGILHSGTYGDSFLTAHNSQTVAIDVDQNNQVYASVDGVLFSKDLSVLIRYPNNKYQEGGRLIYNVPETVTEIYAKAFYCNTKLTSIKLANATKKIGSEAFYECLNLNQIEFNENLECIETDAFRKCNLQRIILPTSVQVIKSRAFSYNEQLVEVFIDVNVKEFGGNIFTSCNDELTIYTPSSNVSVLKGNENLIKYKIEAAK